MQHFADDDSGYLSWLADHLEGFVLNTTQTPSSAYLMLYGDLLDNQPPATSGNYVHG